MNTPQQHNEQTKKATTIQAAANNMDNSSRVIQDNRSSKSIQKNAKININDDKSLEKEADNMGQRAIQMKVIENEKNELSKDNLQDKVVAQRTVLSKVYDLSKGGTKIVYYSTYDPSQEFDNQFDAWKLDTKLAKEKRGEFDEEERYPTNFTHYNTDSRNIPPSVGRAGPHTLSHSSLSYRLSKQIKTKSLKELRDEQVPDVSDFLDLLMTEAPSKIKSNILERLLEDYKISYNRLDKIIKGAKESYEGEGYELLMRLIQLNPYTTYGKGKKPSGDKMKGKGEKKEDSFEEAFDEKAKFNSDSNYTKFKLKRKKLYEDSEKEEEEKSEPSKKVKKTEESKDLKTQKEDLKTEKEDNKKEIEDENDDNTVLSPMDVMILLGRTTRGTLYIFGPADWKAYNQYKKDNPDKKYSR